LDAYWLSNRKQKQFFNERKGVKALTLWAREAGLGRVIFEAAGVYHQPPRAIVVPSMKLSQLISTHTTPSQSP
jgi:hypothetical protein